MEEEKEVLTDEPQVETKEGEAAEESTEETKEESKELSEDEQDADYWKNKYFKEQRLKAKSTPVEADDVVKKSDLEKSQERLAISQIENSDDEASKEIAEHWDEVMKAYTPRHGRNTKEDILEDIMDAHAVWKRNYKPKDTSKEAAAELSQVHGRGGASPSDTPSNKQRILPKRQTMDKWYED